MPPKKPDCSSSRSTDPDFFFTLLTSLSLAQLNELERYFISLNDETKKQ